MGQNFDRKALGRLMRAPTFSPTDCPNFITYKDFNQYRWYVRSVAPLLVVTRGGPIFVGHRTSTLFGESPGEAWMVVRYPNHRAMIRMVSNPYYLLVANRFREKGTARLEIAFTQPRTPASKMATHPVVLGLHVDTRDADGFFGAAAQCAEDAGVAVVYESDLRLNFDFIRRPRSVDPNPLTYPTTVALAGDSAAALRDLARSDAVQTLLGAQTKACAQLYQRAGRWDLLRFGSSPGHLRAHSF